MAIGGSRIYHVNSNCTDLARSVAFYEALGLQPVTRTVPSRPQPGSAFGLDEVAWDAWMLQGDCGYDGLSLDLLQWTVPPPTGASPATMWEPGFSRLVLTVPELDQVLDAVTAHGGRLLAGPSPVVDPEGASVPTAMVADPDGVAVQLEDGDDTRIARVVVNTVDLDESLSYYLDVLGLRLVGRWEGASADGSLFGVEGAVEYSRADVADSGSQFGVSLVQWHRPVAPTSGDRRVRGANELGLFRMAWSTDDCARDEAVVRAAGSEPFAPTGELSVGDDLPLLRVLFWPGPDGECLELIEVTSASGALD
ncbi:VOC family protein [Rhabdothermincola salaria]|uniref:VOC family protein n=1 Tax=Rhabdothermincola salaria TaxID=2903142 RepID=UPI001E41A5B3|nr:VOC family protein [Rhabdothermincola salaria]MCD9624008.1 VOC family protein [Rhabdothermincola salaria]